MSYITSIKKNTFLFLATIGIINTFLAIIVFIYIKNQQKELLYHSNFNLAKTEFRETNKAIESEIRQYKLILSTLKETKDLNRLLNGNKDTIKYLKEDFSDFVKASENIFQLRFIDELGQEIIRIDKDNKHITKIVTTLQNKASRYYFKKTKEIKNGEFYISDFDLNIEHGKIEVPFKPTIRISTPIYRNNEFKGIIIINFLASDLINLIKDKEQFDVYFMDNNGNFLLHPDEKKNWSTQRKTNYKVKDEIPYIEELLNTKQKESIDKNKLFYINKVHFTDNDFYIIYSIKENIYTNHMKENTKSVISFFIVIFLLSIPFVLLGAYLQSIRMRILDKLINNIPFPICLKDKNGLFLIVNDSLAKLYGYSLKEELIGKKSYDFTDKDLPYTSKRKDDYVLKKQKLKFIDTVTLKNNEKLYYDTRIIKMSFLGLFNKTYILGVAIDITAMKTLNEELQKKVNEELEKRLNTERILSQKAKLAEMGNMIDHIIHQWKQPLSIIKVTSQALEMNLEFKNLSEEQRANYIKTIIENVDFMSDTANDFRSFLSPDKIKSEFTIKACTDKILKILFLRFRKQKVEIVNNIDIDIKIHGYKSELSQVLLNIFNNALDAYSEKEEIEDKKIIINAYEKDKNLILEIEDNAGGIKEKALNHVFEDRFTTKDDNGTGIGLTISKRIIEESFKGTIEIKNKNKGANVLIKIPI
ncbi:MAG: PAS domain S-box protein [Campylobacteraceae bacterium]|nr:PAS domain S-box protein [Campylobacteraceae bacterium]